MASREAESPGFVLLPLETLLRLLRSVPKPDTPCRCLALFP
jgi:hypothetical protein